MAIWDAENPNEARADYGEAAVCVVARQTNTYVREEAHTSIVDVMAYMLHFGDRFGLDARDVIESAWISYEGDFEDGPRVATIYNEDQSLAEALGREAA